MMGIEEKKELSWDVNHALTFASRLSFPLTFSRYDIWGERRVRLIYSSIFFALPRSGHYATLSGVELDVVG